ncbi:SWIM zinc finger family protein, partial [Streptomyces sp. NPDC059456]|uniref:SWIM zinc finger family protein n=1 Tax=Streptomyces sp. NPDC059456 TaxID=3346838 RepID=UPI0036A2BFF7
MSTDLFPPVAPEVLAEAVENLTARLRKKLDAAIEGCAAGAVRADDGSVSVRFGEDALVTLRPGPTGAIASAEQADCTCLLAPRCLHRAAVLGAAPLADAAQLPAPQPWAGPGAAPAPARGGRAGARGRPRRPPPP